METIIISITTLLAVFIGYILGLRQMKTKMRMDFIERQLREFYSPLIGYRKRINAISELRVNIFKASDTKWKEFCRINPNPTEEDFKPYKNSIIYDSKQFREEVMPLYNKMVSVFTENYYMSESETKKWYDELLRFVEIWHCWLDEAIPKEVIVELNHTEERLKPFYADLDNEIDRLRKKLSN